MGEVKKEVIALLGVNLGTGNLGEEVTASALVDNIKKKIPSVKILEVSSNPGDTRIRHQVESIPIKLISEKRYGGLVESHFDKLDLVQPNGKVSKFDDSTIVGRFSYFSVKLKKIPPLFALAKFLLASLANIKILVGEIAFLVRSYYRLKPVNKLIIAGSGPLADNFGGPMGYPYMILKWVLLSKLRNIPVIFFSVGAVPLVSQLSEIFIRVALNMATYRSYRDDTSRHITADLGSKPDDGIYPDIAFSLNLSEVDIDIDSSTENKSIGIGLFPHFDPRYWPEKNENIYNRYIYIMAEFAAWLSDEGYHVIFLSTQVKADVDVTQDVISLLKSKGIADSSYSTPRVETHVEFIRQAKRVEVMVQTRFHGMIMTLLSGTPVIALTNQQKMVELMKGLDLDHFMEDIDKVDLRWLKEIFFEVIMMKGELIADIEVMLKKNSLLLEKGYEDILRI